MLEDFRIDRIPLQYDVAKNQLRSFLRRYSLTYEEDIEAAFGVFDSQDTLYACGCAAGSLLKCFAVAPELRGQNALGSLVSALTQERFSSGCYDLFIITRAANEPLFSNCGFFPVVRTTDLVLLENRPDGPERFVKPFWNETDSGKLIGSVVMNCNPFTLGHRALVEYAAAHCDLLHIFVVEEDRSLFSTELRLQMVTEGTSDLSNVRIHLSGPYMISSATFPTYFLKADEDAATLQSQLDITLFAERIAPALHISRRFVGAEPDDPVTACYNESMRTILPLHGISFFEMPRYAQNSMTVSASRVRRLLTDASGRQKALSMLPDSTQRCLLQWKELN